MGKVGPVMSDYMYLYHTLYEYSIKWYIRDQKDSIPGAVCAKRQKLLFFRVKHNQLKQGLMWEECKLISSLLDKCIQGPKCPFSQVNKQYKPNKSQALSPC